MNTSRPVLCAVSLAALLALTPAAQSQTARSGSGPSQQLVQQMQQLATERTQLQEELTRTKKELDDTRKERDDLKKGQQAIEVRAKSSSAALAQSATQKAATEQELTQTKARLQEIVNKFRDTITTFRQVEAEGTTAKQNLATRDQQLKVCSDRNAALYKLNGDILTSWEHEGSFARAARAEPVTKIKRVELENLLDDYQDHAGGLRYTPGSPLPRTAPPPQPTPPPAAPAPAADPGH
jgi:chromosome segregation ATPase